MTRRNLVVLNEAVRNDSGFCDDTYRMGKG